MSISTTVKNALTAFAARRPVSHLAAITLLGTSIYAVHEGAVSILPAGLAAATTAAMVGAEWLQWTALGRLAKIEDARDDIRAGVMKGQCAGIGAFQVILYTMAVTNFAREAGLDWSQGWALAGTIAIAALFASLNFVAKWTSCDQVGGSKSTGPTGGQRVHHAIFSAPALAAPAANDAEVISFDLEKAIRDKTARMEALEASALAAAPPVRSAPVRLRLAEKRMKTRAWREGRRAAA